MGHTLAKLLNWHSHILRFSLCSNFIRVLLVKLTRIQNGNLRAKYLLRSNLKYTLDIVDITSTVSRALFRWCTLRAIVFSYILPWFNWMEVCFLLMDCYKIVRFLLYYWVYVSFIWGVYLKIKSCAHSHSLIIFQLMW